LFDIGNFIINSGETKKFETDKFFTNNSIVTPSFRELSDNYYNHGYCLKNKFLIIKYDKQQLNFVIDNSNLFFKDNQTIHKSLSNRNLEEVDVKSF
jgi:hypothetical protein